MRLVCLLLFCFTFFASMAQDGGYPDYRSKKENFIKVRETDLRNDLASFTMAGLDESMDKLLLKTIPMKELGANSMMFEGEHIKVLITAGPFDAGKHKLNYYSEKYLLKIDNKVFYGSYGSVPKNSIQSVSVLINNDTIPIPVEAFNDIYDPGFTYKDASGTQRSQNRVYVSNDNRTIYIYMLDRNHEGTEVTWIIQNKKYIRRVLDFGFLK